jgi:ribonuclease D
MTDVNDPDAPAPEVVPLTDPADGIPPVTSMPDDLLRAAAALAHGTGPVAADAERASGYRYGQATYLIQLRRAGAGTFLIDPQALPDLAVVNDAVADAEWVLHAAGQDLPGLGDHGLKPARIFDTELAARLLGFERVGLAAVVERCLGYSLAKEHSAVDWSTRPLPLDWLRYAALDVEVLVQLRDHLTALLVADGKDEWAAQEFEHERTALPSPPKPDPWRRLSGGHPFGDQRKLAVARALWLARDASARRRDIAPGRVLPDRAITAAANNLPRTAGQLIRLPEFSGRGQRRRAAFWQRAINEALALPKDALPPLRGPAVDGPPAPRNWADRDPAAAARLTAARAVVAAVSQQHRVPAENLVQPDAVRRLCWTPPDPITPEAVAATLAARGVRPWQLDLVAAPLAHALE